MHWDAGKLKEDQPEVAPSLSRPGVLDPRNASSPRHLPGPEGWGRPLGSFRALFNAALYRGTRSQ